jgi:hypothetical protein
MKSYYLRITLNKGDGAMYTSVPRQFVNEEEYSKELEKLKKLLEQLPNLVTLHIEVFKGNVIFFPQAILAESIVEIVIEG